MTDKPTKWSTGIADKAWKIMICAREEARAVDLIQGVAAILDNPGHCSVELSADVLRRFSGDQIADALLDYRRKSHAAVIKGIELREGDAQ